MMFVGKPSAIACHSLAIKEYILERNLTNVRSVGKLFGRVYILLFIQEFTLEKNPTNVRNAGKLFEKVHS